MPSIARGMMGVYSSRALAIANGQQPSDFLQVFLLPGLAGVPLEGQVVTVTPGEYSSLSQVAVTGQFLRDGVAISGATGTTYTFVTADVGALITYRETAVNSTTSIVAVSNPIGPIEAVAVAPSASTAPTISDTTPTEGQTLTITPGTYIGTTPITVARQMQRETGVGSGTYADISGAMGVAGDATTYVVLAADVGRRLRVREVGTNLVSSSANNFSSATSAVVAATPQPVIANQSFGPVPENASIGAVVGTVVNTGGAVGTWAIDAGPFAISATGVITVASPLDYDTASSHSQTVTATNDAGSDTATITITVSEVTTGQDAIASIGFHGVNMGGASRQVFFGQGFAEGELLTTDTFAARTVDTLETLPTQSTALATWNDGSVKHAAVVVTVPAVADGAIRACEFVKGLSFASGSNVSLATALSGRTLSVTITPASGSPITQNLYALIGSARRIEGPLATETRIEWQVPSANLGGVTSLRLVVDVRAHANGDVWVYPWFRNDIALRAGGGKPVFAATMTMDGNTIINFSQFTMQQYMAVAIGMFGTNSSGTLLPGAYSAGKPEKPFVQHDLSYLARAGFIPEVATDLAVAASWKTGTVNPILASATWYNPLDRRGIGANLGAAGAAEQIGWLTSFQSGWLVSNCTYFDAWRVARGWAEAATRMEGQFWAADNIDPPQWVNLDMAPRFTVHQSQTSVAGTAWASARGVPTDQARTLQSYPIASDLGHQGGGWYWLVYVLEAEAAHADNHAALGAWMNMSTTQRQGGYAPPATPINWDTAEYTGFEYTATQGTYRTQGRGFGWALLNWVRGAFILPDDYPARAYFNNVARGHINWLQRAINEYSALMSATYGAGNVTLKALPWDTTNQSYAGEREVNWGWQTDFIRWALAEAKQKGVGTEATVDSTQAWVSDFRVRGLLSPGTGWNRPNACMQMPMGDVHTSGLMYATYEQVQASVVNFSVYPGPEWLGLYASTGGGYMRNAFNVLLLLAELYPQWGDVRDAIAYMAAEDGRTTANRPGVNKAVLEGVTPFYSFSKVGWSRNEGLAVTVVAGQSFTMASGAAAGTQVGCVETEGGIPRAGTRDGSAFAIASGNSAGLFTISKGGVIKRSGTGSVGAGPYILNVTATNDGGTSAAGAVTVTIT